MKSRIQLRQYFLFTWHRSFTSYLTCRIKRATGTEWHFQSYIAVTLDALECLCWRAPPLRKWEHVLLCGTKRPEALSCQDDNFDVLILIGSNNTYSLLVPKRLVFIVLFDCFNYIALGRNTKYWYIFCRI